MPKRHSQQGSDVVEAGGGAIARPSASGGGGRRRRWLGKRRSPEPRSRGSVPPPAAGVPEVMSPTYSHRPQWEVTSAQLLHQQAPQLGGVTAVPARAQYVQLV